MVDDDEGATIALGEHEPVIGKGSPEAAAVIGSVPGIAYGLPHIPDIDTEPPGLLEFIPELGLWPYRRARL